MTPPLGFSAPTHILNDNTNERPHVTTTVFAATTPGNTSFSYYASTSIVPTSMISLAFTGNISVGGTSVHPPQRREESITERNTEGSRPSEARAEESERQEMNLPPLLATYLGRNENGQPLRSSLTSVYGGRQSLINIGGNLPPNGTHLSHHAQPFIPSSAHVPSGFVPTHVTPYCKPSTGIVNGQTLSFPFQAQTGNISVRGTSVHPPQRSKSGSQRRTWQFTLSNKEKARVSELSPLDLPSTYKGLVEKTYTWIEAREVATNGAPNDQRDNFKRSKKSSWDNEKGQKNRDRSLRVDLKIPLVGFSGGYSWPLGEVPLEIKIREGLLTFTKTLNFVIVRSDSPHNLLLGRTTMQLMGIMVSTIHRAIKFYTSKRIGTLFSVNSPQGPKT
nr:reverse transcriptase domain-containing protein [Tanacetum cinerariifolium]